MTIKIRLLPALTAGLLLTGAAAAAPDDGERAAETDRRPNLIMVLTDDQRYDALGLLNPLLETPQLDRLAREGVHFRNAFVTTSLCSPSRASILSGRTMRSHGVVDNNSPTPAGFESFAERLQAAGYQTAFIGKWHMGSSDASPKPGFDHWVSFEGQGSYAPMTAFGTPAMLNVNGEQVPQDGYVTDVLTRYAVEWIEARGDRPFFLLLSHKAVHLPFTPAGRHVGQYAGVDFPDPPSQDLDARQGPVPMWLHDQRNSWAGVGFPYYSERPVDDIQQDYYGALSAVDDSLGALLQAGRPEAFGRDTVTLYTSDNGFMFGEQGLLDKRAAYEASMRVPLILHGPGRFSEAREVTGLARNIDIAPTLLDLAGVAIPDHYEGRSLVPLADGVDAGPDPALVYEYYWEFNYPQTPSTFALRDDRYKYVQYHGVWDTEELFDLEADPHELHNLIQAPAQQNRVIAMRRALYAALSPQDGRPAVPFTARYNQGAVFWSPAASEATPYPPHWARQAQDDDLYEHIIPDGPDKAQQLRAITPALRVVLGTDDPTAPAEQSTWTDGH